MDATEKHVENSLLAQGFTDILYEPDGNIPPDFLVDLHIAIEVRRLNQNVGHEEKRKGLEEVAIPLRACVQRIVNELGMVIPEESWFIGYRFSRPVEKFKILAPIIMDSLREFAQSPRTPGAIVVNEKNFEMRIICKRSEAHDKSFLVASITDRNSGGWLLNELESNIKYCASEKSKKIEKIKGSYPVWWLALVDHVGYGMDKIDQDQFKTKISIQHDWDKILLINPLDHTKVIEI